MILLGMGLLLSLLLHTIWLGKFLGKKLKLFQEISKKVAAQELDFTVPHAGIREYDEALDAMEEMREALYQALTSQWAAQQQREAEIAALAHDLKTPLTLAGGNAELLLEEELPQDYERLIRKFWRQLFGRGVCCKSSGDFVGKRRSIYENAVGGMV